MTRTSIFTILDHCGLIGGAMSSKQYFGACAN